MVDEHQHAYVVTAEDRTAKEQIKVAGKWVTITIRWKHYRSSCSCGQDTREWDGPEERC